MVIYGPVHSKTRRPVLRKTAVLALALGISLISYMPEAKAEVNVNIGIGIPLPRIVIEEPPDVVVIPGTYVYFAPDVEIDILFYRGWWYRPHRSKWYRCRDYNGPWVLIPVDRIPRAVLHLPPDWRHKPHRHGHIPYGQLKKHWKDWEDEGKWDGDDKESKHHGHKHKHKKDKWDD